MPDIFALQGVGNCGKTETLRILYDELTKKYPNAGVQFIHRGNSDIAVILTGVNGNVVGIETQGDPGSRLDETLKAFVNAGCDIIFCACRTRGMTVDWINARSRQYQIHFIPQNRIPSPSNQNAANQATAASLIQQAGL